MVEQRQFVPFFAYYFFPSKENNKSGGLFSVGILFAYSESKLICHFVLVVVVLLLLAKRSEKVGKRSKKVASS